MNPLGITSGKIPDSAINATSERENYEARNIRYNFVVSNPLDSALIELEKINDSFGNLLKLMRKIICTQMAIYFTKNV